MKISKIKRMPRNFFALFMTVVMVAIFILPMAASAVNDSESELYSEDAEMNLDVIFVLDASGSMLESDPNKVALDAFNLFVDLCDETCSVGYVVYTEKIKDSSDLVPISNKKNLDTMKNKISNIQYDPNGDTDIALGLTKAMQMHDKTKSDSKRKKIIVLLSDGNTHLIGSTRTVAESQKEMEQTLKELKSKDIPVYSIGLNYDGTLDKKESEKISSSTNGRSFEIKSSANLTGIASDIFGKVYNLDGEDKEIVNGIVTINVKDSSVFYVNVIVKSRFTRSQLDPKITTPRGETIPVSEDIMNITGKNEAESIKVTSAGTYTLIKMIYPKSGTWKISLKNANNENCQVTQLDFYSVYIGQTLPKEAAINSKVEIIASMNDREGVVKDEDLLDTITMTTTVTGKNSGTKLEIPLTKDTDGVYKGEFTPKEVDVYRIQTTAKSDKFTKESRIANVAVREFVQTSKSDNGDLNVSGKSDGQTSVPEN